MIEDDYVNVGVAQLMKENGFDEPTPMVYYNYSEDNGYELEEVGGKFDEAKMLHAPSLNVAVKWIRVKSGVHISAWPIGNREEGRWEADIRYEEDGIDATLNACGHIFGNTFEECMNKAISYTILLHIA